MVVTAVAVLLAIWLMSTLWSAGMVPLPPVATRTSDAQIVGGLVTLAGDMTINGELVHLAGVAPVCADTAAEAADKLSAQIVGNLFIPVETEDGALLVPVGSDRPINPELAASTEFYQWQEIPNPDSLAAIEMANREAAGQPATAKVAC